MGKLVLFNIGEGDFQRGFPVTLQIFEEGDRRLIANTDEGRLPPARELPERYESWQKCHSKKVRGRYSTRITVKGSTEKETLAEIEKAKKKLHLSVNNWLNPHQVDLNPIWTEILKTLKDEDEEIRVIVKTKNKKLQQLPWYIWDEFFKHYRRAEVCLYLPVTTKKLATAREKVKVLAVFGKRESVGNNTRIKTEQDWEMLKRHLSQESNAELILLDEPTLEELCDRIEEQSPQILFFAGHSYSEEDGANGIIELNQEDRITIDYLNPYLREAVDRGLQLAIFNSCEGLGIARQLADLYIPNIIVMREPVPDEVAQKFLQRFLEAFAAGKPLHVAVRKAREKINHLERKFPGATWLPTIFQNPAEAPLTWQGLGGVEVHRQSDQVAQPGEGSEAENQSSILWLRTTINNLYQVQQKKTAPIVSNTSNSKPKMRSQIARGNHIRLVASLSVITTAMVMFVVLLAQLMLRKADPHLNVAIKTAPESSLPTQPTKQPAASSIPANTAPTTDVPSAEDEHSLTTQPMEQQGTLPSHPPVTRSTIRRAPGIFSCRIVDGVPTTIITHPVRGEVIFIRWVSNYGNQSSFANCQEASARLQLSQSTGILNYIVIDSWNQEHVLCASRSVDGPCESFLFKVPPGYDPDEIVRQINNINIDANAPSINL